MILKPSYLCQGPQVLHSLETGLPQAWLPQDVGQWGNGRDLPAICSDQEGDLPSLLSLVPP